MRKFAFLTLILTSECAAFTARVGKAERRRSLKMADDGSSSESTRRSFLAFSGSLLAGLASLALTPEEASAKDELFKPNPLTNPLLEQVSNVFTFLLFSTGALCYTCRFFDPPLSLAH